MFDRIHPGVEVAQEALHRLLAGFLPVPEPLGELDLVFEVQLVGLPAAEMMQVVADVPHEIQGLPEGLVFGVGEQPQVLEIPGLAQVVFEARDPDHRVVVPQPALALLEVRFQQVRGVPVVGVAAVRVGHQLFEMRPECLRMTFSRSCAISSENSIDMPQMKRASRMGVRTFRSLAARDRHSLRERVA